MPSLKMFASAGPKAAIGAVLALGLGCELDPSGGTSSSTSSTSSASSSGSSGTGTASGLVSLDVDALCTKLITQCGYTAQQSDCISTFFPLRVTSACKNAIPNAACADLLSNTSLISTTCFPTCTKGTAPVCNGDGSITLCVDSGNTHRNDCRDSCTSDGYTAWTGSCGTTFDGQTATQPQCWCR